MGPRQSYGGKEKGLASLIRGILPIGKKVYCQNHKCSSIWTKGEQVVKNNAGDNGETFRVIIMNRSKHMQPVFCQLTDQNYKSVQTNLQFSFQKNLRRIGEPFVIVEKNDGSGLSKWSNISDKSEGIILSHIWDINRAYLSL